MNPENNPSGAQGDVSHVNTPPAPGNVGSGTPAAVSPEISLSELNSLLGKTFPTKDAALKSLKDTQSYVGMKKEDIEKEVLARNANNQDTTALAKQIEDMRKDNFYRDNPSYNKPEIKALIEKLGKNPADIVNSPEFKPFFEKVQGFDEVQKLRTVLDSNPRLATSRDALTKTADSIKAAGRRTQEDEAAIADAVLATLQ